MVAIKIENFYSVVYFATILASVLCDEATSLDSCNKDDVFCEAGFLIDESLNQLQQDDSRLIEEIRKRLMPIPPFDKPYNFTNKNPDLKGQYDQAEIVSDLFKDQKNGFFIEAGAYDGEVFSNSLYYEVTHGWKGLLVEPNPDALKDLISKNRRAHIFGHCISTKNTPEIVDFDAAGLLGGIINKNKRPADFEIDQREVRNRPKDYKPMHPYHRRTIRAQCFPLYSILLALGNPTVDIFSLDIEGAEFKVLETIPWSKVNIRLLIIETNHAGEIFEGNTFQIRKLMKDNGYKLYKSAVIDDIYIKRKF